MADSIEKVGKLEAAERQIREAILLFFERRDPVAIHTLAAASHQILVDIASDSGKISFLKTYPLLLPEKKGEWFSLINKAHNFFKHADHDPAAVLEFRPETTAFFILDSIQLYNQLTNFRSLEQNAFFIWFSVKYPHTLVDGPFKEIVNNWIAIGITADDFSNFLALAKGDIPLPGGD